MVAFVFDCLGLARVAPQKRFALQFLALDRLFLHGLHAKPSQKRRAMCCPVAFSISRIQVGLVTFNSVR